MILIIKDTDDNTLFTSKWISNKGMNSYVDYDEYMIKNKDYKKIKTRIDIATGEVYLCVEEIK